MFNRTSLRLLIEGCNLIFVRTFTIPFLGNKGMQCTSDSCS